MSSEIRLETRGLSKQYEVKKFLKPSRSVKALTDVDLQVKKGKTLAVVGESGCGKSTLAKVLMGIEGASSGEIHLDGVPMGSLPSQVVRRKVQMIFQDPYGSLNPRMKVWKLISEPLRVNTSLSVKECRVRAMEMMAKVGLRPEFADRYPHMFSGGQRQRIGIARALILEPEVLICDEPVSALDVSIQAQVINLLLKIQDDFGLSYLFISHDLSVVRHVADEVAVIYLGRVVEKGNAIALFKDPKHPYTQLLLASTPKIGSAEVTDDSVKGAGELPSPFNPPSGCAFHKRCPRAMEKCSQEIPKTKDVQGLQVACHLY